MRGKRMYKGNPASAGIALGKAFVLPPWEWDVPEKNIDVNDLSREFERLYESIRTSKHEIKSMKQEMNGTVSSFELNIFDTHLAILDDPVFMQEIRGIIERQYKAAEVAVKEVIDQFVDMFDVLDDQYMKERALDIKDVGQRLLQHLAGAPQIELPQDNQPFILVAPELSPSQLAHLNPSHVQGILTLTGGKTSHAAILARAMGIPLIIGWEGMLEQPIQTGDFLIIDGENGNLYVGPDEQTKSIYSQKQQHWIQQRDDLQDIISLPTQTKDQFEMILRVNITSEKEVERAFAYGAAGIGLYRTEYLYMDRPAVPSEDDQVKAYLQLAEKSPHEPVLIRTLDVGGDKCVDSLSFPEEENPALGYRAIRISLNRQTLFKTQLRAILRASIYRNIKIIYPMITRVEEVKEANRVLQTAKDELSAEGIAFDPNIDVGIMIEVPAAALIADALAKEVDFFSIGTNDLIQFTLAVDRLNENIAHLYDPFHPAVLRMLKLTVEAAHSAGIGLSVCGEMAGDVRALPLWIGMGVNKLSMSVESLLPVKKRILEIHESDCKHFLEKALQCSTGSEVTAILENMSAAIAE